MTEGGYCRFFLDSANYGPFTAVADSVSDQPADGSERSTRLASPGAAVAAALRRHFIRAFGPEPGHP